MSSAHVAGPVGDGDRLRRSGRRRGRARRAPPCRRRHRRRRRGPRRGRGPRCPRTCVRRVVLLLRVMAPPRLPERGRCGAQHLHACSEFGKGSPSECPRLSTLETALVPQSFEQDLQICGGSAKVAGHESVRRPAGRAATPWSGPPSGRCSSTAPTRSCVHVAEAAGLTSGAVLYHFPDVQALLLEANRAGMERFYDERVAAARGARRPGREAGRHGPHRPARSTARTRRCGCSASSAAPPGGSRCTPRCSPRSTTARSRCTR